MMHANRPLSDLYVRDRNDLQRYLDQMDKWRELASHVDFRAGRALTSFEISRIADQHTTQSPTRVLLDRLEEVPVSILDLFNYVQKAKINSALEILRRYVPRDYQIYGAPQTPAREVIPQAPSMELIRGSVSERESSINYEIPVPSLPSISSSGLSTFSLSNSSLSSYPRSNGIPPNSAPNSGIGRSPRQPPTGNSNPIEPPTPKLRSGLQLRTTRTFTYAEISKATSNFSDRHRMHKGKFCDVYRALINNTEFAIKKFHGDAEAIKAAGLSFQNLTHPNIVSILGQCEGDNAILLYDYMENQSLKYQLHERKNNTSPLEMIARIHILQDAACGLQYLHSDKPPLIHGNIKSSNILLDENMRAKLSDFGQAHSANRSSSTSPGYTHYSTQKDTSVLSRNKGYLAPEITSGKPSVSTDTYAFGVVILEMLSGRPAFEKNSLVDMFDKHNGDKFELADNKSTWKKSTFDKLWEIAKTCLDGKKKNRPKMDKVYADLTRLAEELEVYNQPPQRQVNVHQNNGIVGYQSNQGYPTYLTQQQLNQLRFHQQQYMAAGQTQYNRSESVASSSNGHFASDRSTISDYRVSSLSESNTSLDGTADTGNKSFETPETPLSPPRPLFGPQVGSDDNMNELQRTQQTPSDNPKTLTEIQTDVIEATADNIDSVNSRLDVNGSNEGDENRSIEDDDSSYCVSDEEETVTDSNCGDLMADLNCDGLDMFSDLGTVDCLPSNYFESSEPNDTSRSAVVQPLTQQPTSV